ncbi:MAG: peptide-methionine (S)-S-oxide reductase MsrA [Rhodomicrobium sp.]|nr:peptide-methionine (S)-S-oxide reductase MsrA [Rhodomicrobium sp.]
MRDWQRRTFAVLAYAVAGFSTALAAEPATAVFAGGCFWCVEADFEKLEGVEKAVSGYAGGDLANPTYRNHGSHLEAVEVTYDPDVVSYRALVDYHLRHIDPLDDGGQFCDRGHSYTTAIFYSTEAERAAAGAAVTEAETVLGQKIVTPVLQLGPFHVAEDYHQDYYKKNKARYAYYRSGCGRDRRVKQIWGDR